jgi:transcriptional regulator with XRE-family HTH domain
MEIASLINCQAFFSRFGRICQRDFDRKPNLPGSELPKTIHTERHKRFCEVLKARRKAAGLTQTVLAERLGKPPSYVAKYEGGDRRLDVLEFLDVAAAIGFVLHDAVDWPASQEKSQDCETGGSGGEMLERMSAHNRANRIDLLVKEFQQLG